MENPNLINFINTRGPFTDPETMGEPSEEMLINSKILVLGAGGLGCEILKNLSLMGVKNITVIDLDTIDISNLNRQFLFRVKDVGKYKAEVAAEFVMNRIKGVKIEAIVGKIQDQPEDFYSQFQLIISGLDNIETRRWINQKLFEQTQQDPPQYTYLIDGGTEGLKGQARIMVPGIIVCFECTLDLFPPKTKFPLCTLANTPRLPEHCIEWASLIHWPEVRPDEKVDGDNWDHIQWLYTAAKARADAHNIEGVTLTLTQGVVKNIIPAIASTNAIVAANCCNEAFKVLTMTNPGLNNYATYNGVLGVSSTVIEMEKSESCFVCSNETVKVEVSEEWTLSQLLLHFKLDPKFQAKNPSVRTASKTLYMSQPAFLEKSTRKNLELPLSELVGVGDQLSLTDPVFPNYITVDLVFKEGLLPPKEDTLD